MARRGEERAGVGVLDDASQVHHGNPCRDDADDGEVVRDEDIREPEPRLQIAQQIDHLGLDRNVQRRHRLVADDETRLDRERTRNADPLSLAARKFMRKAARVRGREAYLPQDLGDALRPPSQGETVQRERLGQRLPHRHPRIERCEWILEDDLQRAPVRPERAFVAVPSGRRRRSGSCPQSGR